MNQKIIGSKPDGTAINHLDLKEGIAISEQNFDDGKYSTIESFAKKWNIN